MSGPGAVQKTLTIRPKPAELAGLREKIGVILKKLPEKTATQLVLAVDEAVSAVMSYNREKGFDRDVSLTLDVNDVRFKASLIDPQLDFDPAPTYRQLHGDRKYKISFFLICKVMDEVSYTYKRGFENRLELIKFL